MCRQCYFGCMTTTPRGCCQGCGEFDEPLDDLYELCAKCTRAAKADEDTCRECGDQPGASALTDAGLCSDCRPTTAEERYDAEIDRRADEGMRAWREAGE